MLFENSRCILINEKKLESFNFFSVCKIFAISNALQHLEENMNTSVKAVGFTMDPKQSEMVDSKLKRISYAEDLIIDLMMHIKLDKKFSFDTTVNFRWGASAHVTGEDYDFGAALNSMMDVLDNKIKKEKDKIQGR